MGVSILALGTQVASTAMAFDQASGIEAQGKLQAAMEDVAALQRETDRKAQLARSISTQRATASASGITLEGSPLTVIDELTRQESVDTGRDKFNTEIKKQSIRFSSKQRASALRLKAGISLLQSGQQAAAGSPLQKPRTPAPVVDARTD